MLWEIMHAMSSWLAGSTTAWTLIGVAASVLYTGGVGLLLHRENKDHSSTARYGHDQAFKRFRRLAAALMALVCICLFLLPIATAGTLTLLSAPVALTLGLLLVVGGLAMKTWTDRTLGNDGFFWRDMFMPTDQRNIVLDKSNLGPYRYFKNPMYSIGNLHIIGWALAWRSQAGILVAIFELCCLYVFYRLVELPHVKAVNQLSLKVEKSS